MSHKLVGIVMFSFSRNRDINQEKNPSYVSSFMNDPSFEETFFSLWRVKFFEILTRNSLSILCKYQ